MKLSFVSLFPELLQHALSFSIPDRAAKKNLVSFSFANPRDYTEGAYRQVDDSPFGGGPGMVMQLNPLAKAIEHEIGSSKKKPLIVMPSPSGRPWDQAAAERLSKQKHVILLCGRYEGIDARIKQLFEIEEYSVADAVVSGGEFPALMLADAIIRRLPGALGNAESLAAESFEQGYLDHPHYTRPEVFGTMAVPSVLLSGAHRNVEAWRLRQALRLTWQQRPELLASLTLSPQAQSALADAVLKPKESL